MDFAARVLFSRAHLPLLLVALAAALAVLGARWSLIARVGSPVPFQDQWYAEGEDLYLNAATTPVPVGHFLKPHNDHRIVPTRLLAYALFRLNHQWDVRVQMMVNAGLAALLCLPLLALARPWLSSAGLAGFAAALAWFYALPVLYENALWGFQSQFYFLILFSLLHLLLVLGRPAFSPGWWLGLAAGLAALSSLGSGVLAPAAVTLVAAGRWWREPDQRRAVRPTLVAAAVLTLLGALWLPPRLNGAPGFQPGLFFHTLGHALDFPRRGVSAFGFLLWLPFAGFLGGRLFARRASDAERVLLAAGAWVLLQVVAIGVARPESGPVLANRYGDILAVGLVVNLAAGAWLWSRFAARAARGLLLVALGGWLAFVGDQARLDAKIFQSAIAPEAVALRDEQLERIRRFYRSNEPAAITGAAYPHIPVVDAPSLVRDLDLPGIRDAMPVELRNPLPLGFPAVPDRPSLNNAVPISLPNEPGALHRGTWLGPAGPAATVAVTSLPAHKHPDRRLLFKVAGDFVAGETELRIHDAQGSVAAVITGFKSDTLRPVIVSVPGETFRVEVIDRSATRWLAFLEPLEIGPLSQAALEIQPAASWIARLGWGFLAGLLVWFAWVRLKPHPARPEAVAQ